MRTTVHIDNELIERARSLIGLKTKREVVEEALRTIIRLRTQESVRELRGKLHWEGDLEKLRQERRDDPR